MRRQHGRSGLQKVEIRWFPPTELIGEVQPTEETLEFSQVIAACLSSKAVPPSCGSPVGTAKVCQGLAAGVVQLGERKVLDAFPHGTDHSEHVMPAAVQRAIRQSEVLPPLLLVGFEGLVKIVAKGVAGSGGVWFFTFANWSKLHRAASRGTSRWFRRGVPVAATAGNP